MKPPSVPASCPWLPACLPTAVIACLLTLLDPLGQVVSGQLAEPAATRADDGAKTGETRATRRGVGTDWPRFLGPHQDGKSAERGIETDWTTNSPRVVWRREIGISYGIGSVSNGRLYQFDRYGDNARLTCMEAATGKNLWKFEYPTDYVDAFQYNGGPRCSPVVDDGRVYVFGVEGMLHCLDADDGKPLWKIDTSKEFGVVQNFFGVGSTPVVEGDLLIAMIGGSPAEDQGTPTQVLDRVSGNGSGIVAFDKRTGAVRYKITDELASYASLKVATIRDRRWCFAFARGGLLGFEPSTGKVDFHYPWRAPEVFSVNASVPVVVGDEVFISETYGPGSSLLKVTPGKYEVIWSDSPRSREKSMQAHWNTPIHHEGYLYGSSGRHASNAELRCIEWKTGKVTWSVPGLARTSLLFVDGHFICLGEFGAVTLFRANPERFEKVAQVLVTEDDRLSATAEEADSWLRPYCWAAPILARGLLYLRGDRRLVCLDLNPTPP